MSSADMDYQIVDARSGSLTLIADGKALHSRFDPEKEAARTAKRVPGGMAIVILAGLGLGYVAEALLESAPERRLIIVEHDPEIPGLADESRGIRKILENPVVTLMIGGNPGDVSELLTGGPSGAAIYYLDWKPSVATAPEWYAMLQETVEETIRRRQVNAKTLDRFGPLWVRNLAANVPAISRGASLAPAENKFRNIPALILAGGPSLEALLPHLPVIAESHLIIAVDTALPALLRSGVKPDVVTAVDPQYWNTRHLDRCGDGSGDALILAEAATHPAVFRILKGRPWLTRTRFPLGTLLEDSAGIDGELKAGGSVATAAWDLARHLGCSPMAIAGLDLGFPGKKTHYTGSLARELPLKWSHRTSPAENNFYHALHDANTRPVATSGGDQILTDARMDVYAAWFAESVSRIADREPATVGSAGRKIEGMSAISIDELKTFPNIRNDIENRLDSVRQQKQNPNTSKIIATRIKEVLDSLKDLEHTSQEGMEIAILADKLLKNGEDCRELLQKMDWIDHRILEGDGRELISFLIQPLILEISSNFDNKSSDPINNSYRLYKEMAESASYHIRYLQNAL